MPRFHMLAIQSLKSKDGPLYMRMADFVKGMAQYTTLHFQAGALLRHLLACLAHLCICNWSNRRPLCEKGSPEPSMARFIPISASCYQAKQRNTRTHLPLDEYRECRGTFEELPFKDDLACWAQICGAHPSREASRERNCILTTARASEHSETLFGLQNKSCRPLKIYSRLNRSQEAFQAGIDTSVSMSDANAMVFTSPPLGLLCYKQPGRSTCNKISEQELI